MTSRSDNFNRTNTTTNIGTPSDGGSAWIQDAGIFGVESSQGYVSSSPFTGDYVASLEASSALVDVQVTANVVAEPTFSIYTAPVGRLTDSSNYLLYFPSSTGGGLYRRQAGSYTLLSGFSTTIANGDIYKLTLDGSNLLTAYQNGSSKGSVTSSFNASATRHGIWISGAPTSGGNARADNFSITDNTPAGGSVIRRLTMMGYGA